MKTSVFFILLPAFHAAFAGIFFGVWRMNRLPAAGWAGVCFAIGTAAIPLDLLREPPVSYGFLLAVPLHWAMLWCILNAYLTRHGDRMPAARMVRILAIGTLFILLATWPLNSSYIRITMVTLVAMAVVGIGVLRLRKFRASRLDRAVLALAIFSFGSYFARGIAFPLMHFGADVARHPAFSAYWNFFYIIVALLGLFHGLVLTVLLTLDVNNRHHRANARDALTGVGNRRALITMNAADVGAVLMIDLDHFKQVNDVHGHAAGDAVLQRTAETIVSSCPEGTVIRMGGEEFAVVLPPGVDAVIAAERIRTAIAMASASHAGTDITVTASIGYSDRATLAQSTAELASGTLIDTLLRAADRGLYVAKTNGRNRVMEGFRGDRSDRSPAGAYPDTAAFSTRIAQR